MTNDSLDKIWKTIVIPTYNEMNIHYGGLLCPDYEKFNFKNYYDELILHTHKFYMQDSEAVLNRHKVSAAILIAILQTKPIKKVDSMYYSIDKNGDAVHWPFNESLAITTALSVLNAYILSRADYAFSGKKLPRSIFCNVTKEDKEIFKKGVPISQNERENWEWELYQVRQDGSYNLLTVAHVLKLIERNCRYRYFIENKNINPTKPDEKLFIDSVDTMLSLDDVLK